MGLDHHMGSLLETVLRDKIDMKFSDHGSKYDLRIQNPKKYHWVMEVPRNIPLTSYASAPGVVWSHVSLKWYFENKGLWNIWYLKLECLSGNLILVHFFSTPNIDAGIYTRAYTHIYKVYIHILSLWSHLKN